MFDVSGSEFLLVIIVAVIAIGPKDMPAALRIAGRFIGKMRRMSNHFKSGVETMIREAEMEEMEKKWQEQNRRVMEQHPAVEMTAANNGGADMVPLPSPEDKTGEAELAVQAEVEAQAASEASKPAVKKKPAAKKPAAKKPAAKKSAPKKPAKKDAV